MAALMLITTGTIAPAKDSLTATVSNATGSPIIVHNGEASGTIQLFYTVTAYQFATGLFADVQIEQRGADLVVSVIENPIINRVVFEGNDNVALDDLLIGNLAPSRPILRIQREGNFVRAAWPFAFLGWTLEFTHDLHPPIAWSHGSNLIESNGDELSVRMPVANSQAVFFRLRQSQQP